ncbi:hypothetical protein LSH36_279g01065 [Paralvinella palmiformis]|uniref:Uncharacterized protein n=1 Tax=Paralvinella palmiformis TaxID=53620 RepID=A0AAD9JKP4_9ANNE|nr:hypothetical protein LSH36_279g01065 [Paralvinella palmiformis]
MSTTSTLRSRRSSVVSQHHGFPKVLSKLGLTSSTKFSLNSLAKGAALNARSRRGSQSISFKNGGTTTTTAFAQDEEHQTVASKTTETIHFVYSLAVVKALRTNYQVALFGPPSACAKKPEPVIEIERLPTLYADFQLVSSLLESNQRYADSLRRELEASGQGSSPPGSPSKLPNLSSRKSSIKSNRSRRSRNVGQNPDEPSVPKLPPIT